MIPSHKRTVVMDLSVDSTSIAVVGNFLIISFFVCINRMFISGQI